MVIARRCENDLELLALVRAENAQFAIPLEDWEVRKIERLQVRSQDAVSQSIANQVDGTAFECRLLVWVATKLGIAQNPDVRAAASRWHVS